MRFGSRILVFLVIALGFACGGEHKVATPLETFQTYTKAVKKKDTTTMKLLLSNASIKMHEQQAKAQGVTLDDIVKRETLLAEGQTTVKYRNERVDGDKATLEVMSGDTWETVPFVFEDGAWKIDKQGYADKLIKDGEESDRKIDELINGNRQP